MRRGLTLWHCSFHNANYINSLFVAVVVVVVVGGGGVAVVVVVVVAVVVVDGGGVVGGEISLTVVVAMVGTCRCF